MAAWTAAVFASAAVERLQPAAANIVVSIMASEQRDANQERSLWATLDDENEVPRSLGAHPADRLSYSSWLTVYTGGATVPRFCLTHAK